MKRIQQLKNQFDKMPCDYKKYPANWKKEIVPAILERDNHRCFHCGLPNYAVGYRDCEGNFVPNCGNVVHDLAGRGLDYPSLQRLPYKKARELADYCNEFMIDGDSPKTIVIVLTIMHLDHNTTNNNYDNLAAGCQKCHLAYDKEFHRGNSKETIRKKKGLQKLF